MTTATVPGATTGTVPSGRYVIDFADEGSLLWRVPAERKAEPPKELVEALQGPPQEPEPDSGVLDRLADTLTDWTDKIERPTVILGSLVNGKLPPAEVVPDELAALLGYLRGFVKTGRFAEAIRIGRPLCRLCGLTLRWAMMVESLRLVLHAATALADSGTEAWAEHELGTLYLSIEDVHGASEHLNRARELRRQIGDGKGLAATEHNLGVLSKSRRVVPFAAALAAFGLLLAIVLVLALATPVGPAPPSTSTTATTASAGTPAASPSTVDFGSENVRASTPPESVTLRAPSRSAVNVGAVTIIGADASDFRLGADTCTARKLAPGASCRVSVRFAPTAIGGRHATLSFGDHAGGQRVSLSGTGMQARGLAVRPSALSFGTVTVGQSTGPQATTLSNASGTPIRIASATLTGADPAEFAITSNGCSGRSLAPNGTCTIGVRFAPRASGAVSAMLAIAGQDRGQAQEVALSGIGASSATAAVSPAALAFGEDPYGQTAGPQAVTVANRGSAPLEVRAASIQGADAGDFTIASDGCTGMKIAPGGSCSIGITFTPKAVGSRTATLGISDNASPATQSVALSGDGTGTPTATASPPRLILRSSATTVQPSSVVNLANGGNAPLSVTSVTFTGPGASAFQLSENNCGGRMIAPGASCTVTVALAAAQTSTTTQTTAAAQSQAYVAQLEFVDNATPSPQVVRIAAYPPSG